MKNFQCFVNLRIDGTVRCSYILTNKELTEYSTSSGNLLQLQTTNTIKDHHPNLDLENVKCVSCHYYNFSTHILLIKSFLEQIESSSQCRSHLIRIFKNKVKHDVGKVLNDVLYKCFIVIEAELIKSYVIDYAWGWRLWRDCHITLERECAAAWLSTLGGGFSALGDYSSKFAKRAMVTSLQQMKLAKMSEDESGVARALLFLALAVSQLGYYRHASKLLKKAWTHPSYDPRHKNMCLGVKAKLKYDSEAKKEVSNDDRQDFWELIKLSAS